MALFAERLQTTKELITREGTAVVAGTATDPGGTSFIRVTSGSTLSGITGGISGYELTIINATGSDLTIANNTGGATGDRIVTGTGGNIALPDGAALYLKYSENLLAGNGAWQIVGGVGGVVTQLGEPLDTDMKNIYGFGRIVSVQQAQSGPGTATLDCAQRHIFFKAGGTGNITLDNFAEGQTVTVVIDSTGSSYTITWVTPIRWPSGIVPTPTIAALGASKDVYTFIKIGGQIFGTVAKDLR